MKAPAAFATDLRAVSLSEDEHARIVSLLGREPNHLELGMFGAMWSEHCSYKSSRALLAQLPQDGDCVLQGPGENAGAVDVGDGLAVVFKIESHNHPSAVEPYQGAATGVGGILRDIFTMGARPIAILDSLRFGPPGAGRSQYLMRGVVAGIGGYGNCFGCPTVGGDVYFDDSYAENPLVNAMCVGLVRADDLRRARADRSGDLVLLVGASTGRDGIHGAAFASVEMDEASSSRRPAVQVGNPFLEKLLCEACLRLNQLPGVVAIQDLGAAGLTGAASELAHRGKKGIELDVSRVTRRENGMSAYEVMLSESQERMLVVVRPAAGRRVQQIFSDYELHADLVGTITEDGRMRIRDGARQLADIPLSSLLDGVPLRPVPSPGPAMEQPADRLPQARKAPPLDDPQSWLLRLLASPNLCSRRPIFRTYDHQVLNNTVIPPGQDAALLRIPGTRRGLALSTDGNPRYVALDPYLGTVGAVAEAARNIACTGARPLAVTNCLNFGNPERAFVHRQLQESVRGLGDACRAFGLPVVSGNVSLFNETSGKNIIPSPVVGMVGLLEDLAHRRPSGFQEEGDLIFLLGSSQEELAGSEFERLWGAPLGTSPPLVDLDLERRLQRLLAESVAEALLRSAHDLAEGGLLVALAEACLFSGRGARCAALTGTASPAALYFGESQGRVLVTAAPRLAPDLHRQATSHGIPLAAIGVVGGDELIVGSDIRLRLDAMRDAWETPW